MKVRGNMEELGGYGPNKLAEVDSPSASRASYIQRCEQRIKDAETTLERYNRIKELLIKHPDLEEILTLIGRVNI